MFGKLKDKLKQSLSIFSKKAEEEAEVEQKEVIVEQPIEEPKEVKKEVSKKAEPAKEKPKPKEKKETPKKPAKKEEEKKVKEPKDKTPAPKKEPIIEREVEAEIKLESPEDKKEVKEQVVEQPQEPQQEKEDSQEIKQEEAQKPVLQSEEPKKESKGLLGKIKSSIFKKEKEDDTSPEIKLESKEELKEEKKQPQKELEVESKKQETQINEKQTQQLHVEPQVEKEILPQKETKTPEPKVALEKKESTQKQSEEKKGFFGKVKQTLTTKTISQDKFEDLFWELELVLLENNVSVGVIEKIKQDLKQELVDKPLPRDVFAKIQETLHHTLDEILTFDKVDIVQNVKNKTEKPYVVAFFGINGAGKTTSIAKLAHHLKEHDLSVVLAACDTFRAAAIQQLEEHAKKLDVKIIKHDYGSDAAAVAFDAIKYAQKNKIDVVLIDTAGRLHSNTNLMAELEKIIRVTTPDLKVFVGESITGNDCIEQAEKFNQLVEMDGAILTKADVDEKGGAPLSISYTINKPILFLGVGQEYKDFEEFDKEKILTRLGF